MTTNKIPLQVKMGMIRNCQMTLTTAKELMGILYDEDLKISEKELLKMQTKAITALLAAVSSIGQALIFNLEESNIEIADDLNQVPPNIMSTKPKG